MKQCREGDELSKAKSHTSIQHFDVNQHISWHFVENLKAVLRDTGAMLYQLSYEATHWERGQFIEFISSRAVK